MTPSSRPSTDHAARIAVVTGAARGIGAAVCTRLLADGFTVVGLDRDVPTDCDHPMLSCDVSDHRQVTDVAAFVEREHGPVAVLVNNAAVWGFGAIEDTSPDDFGRVLAVNLGGVFHCTRSFGLGMLSRGSGAVVNMVSIAAQAANPNVGAYSASKAGVLAFTRQTALEWGPRGIRANAVGPGFVPTPGTGQVYDDQAVRAVRSRAVPLRRLGAPDDVANAVSFLCSDQSGYVNGQVLYVDGGVSQSLMTLIPRPASVAGPHLDDPL